MKTRIFATPSEPHFNLESHSLSPNLLEESLNILAEENDKLIDSAKDNVCYFKDGSPVGKEKYHKECYHLVIFRLFSRLQDVSPKVKLNFSCLTSSTIYFTAFFYFGKCLRYYIFKFDILHTKS